MPTAPERLVSEYLISRPDTDLCDRCLAKHTGLPLSAVVDQVTHLGRTGIYLRNVWVCVDCDVHGPVTRALANRA
jgi:hypothetical protein